jgi:plastocyanin domain-containing protein
MDLLLGSVGSAIRDATVKATTPVNGGREVNARSSGGVHKERISVTARHAAISKSQRLMPQPYIPLLLDVVALWVHQSGHRF